MSVPVTLKSDGKHVVPATIYWDTLMDELTALRQRHAGAVRRAYIEGHAAGANDYFEARHGSGVINANKCWAASDAKARLI